MEGQFTTQQLIQQFRGRSPGFDKYSDQEILDQVKQQWPSLLNHVVDGQPTVEQPQPAVQAKAPVAPAPIAKPMPIAPQSVSSMGKLQQVPTMPSQVGQSLNQPPAFKPTKPVQVAPTEIGSETQPQDAPFMPSPNPKQLAQPKPQLGVEAIAGMPQVPTMPSPNPMAMPAQPQPSRNPTHLSQTGPQPNPISGMSFNGYPGRFKVPEDQNTYVDMPGAKPEFPTFLEHVIPSDVTPPAEVRTRIPGEGNAGDSSIATYDVISGIGPVQQDPEITQMLATGQQMADRESSRFDHAQSAVNAQRQPVSGLRKAASIAAGVGMGALTMNPMAGLGMGKMIWEGKRRADSGQQAGYAQNDQTSIANQKDISGVYSGAGQRRAELGQARANQTQADANQMNANTNASKERWSQANPKMNTFTPAGGPSKLVPENAKDPASALASSVDIGTAPSEKPADVTVKVDGDGSPIILVTKNDGTTQASKVPGVKVTPESATAFDQFVAATKQANPAITPEQLRQEMLTWQKASAQQAGANQGAAFTRETMKDQYIGYAISEIDAAFLELAKQDQTLLTDPVKAAKKYQELIARLGQDPEFAPYVQDIMNTPKYKTPTAQKPGMGDIIKEALTPSKPPGQ